MRRLKILLPALVAGLALVASACGSTSSFAAKVGDKRISENELEKELRSIAANGPYLKLVESRQQVTGSGAGTFDAAFTALALTRQIYYELIATELDARKLSVGPEDLAAARATVIEQLQGEDVFRDFPEDYQKELIRRQAQLDVLTLALNGKTGSADDATRAYYDSHKDEFASACVSHILVPDQARAEEIRARISAGEDFAAIARTESQDTQSAQKGGELGCDITRETGFVPEFLQAVFSQPVGEVGAPVKSQFGFHLIKVTARDVPPFEEVKDDARQRLTVAGQEKLLTWLQETVTAVEIEVNPKYGTFNKEGASPGVEPPARPADATATTAPPIGPAPAPAGGGATPP